MTCQKMGEVKWENEREGRACRPCGDNHDTPLTLRFGFPGLGMPGRVSGLKSPEAGEAKGYCVW